MSSSIKKVKKIKQKQKQKQSQQTKINIRIGDISKKKSKSRRRSERNRTDAREKVDTKIQFVPQYIQSGPMITSDTVRSSLQPVNLSEALNKRLGEFEKKINEGIPLQNVEELTRLINKGIETMKRPNVPPPFMYSSASSDSGDMYSYNLPDDEDYSTSWRDFSPINLSEIKFPPVGVPRNEGPEEASSRVWETLFPQGPPRQEFEDDMKYPIGDALEYIPNYVFNQPLGDIAPLVDLPNLPINLPPIEEEAQEEVNYPLVAVESDFIKVKEPENETFTTGIKEKKDKIFLNTGYQYKGKEVYLSGKSKPYMFTTEGEFKPARNVLTPSQFRKLEANIQSKNLKFLP